MIVQPVFGPAMAKADYSAVFLSRAREMEFRRVVAAVSFAVRSLLAIGLFAVGLFAAVPFGLCRSPICFATAGFVPAADPSDPAGSGLAVVVVAAAAVVVVVAADLFGLSAAVAAGLCSVGSVVVAADLACPVYFACSAFSVGAALGKGTVVAVPFCSLTHQSSF